MNIVHNSYDDSFQAKSLIFLTKGVCYVPCFIRTVKFSSLQDEKVDKNTLTWIFFTWICNVEFKFIEAMIYCRQFRLTIIKEYKVRRSIRDSIYIEWKGIKIQTADKYGEENKVEIEFLMVF